MGNVISSSVTWKEGTPRVSPHVAHSVVLGHSQCSSLSHLHGSSITLRGVWLFREATTPRKAALVPNIDSGTTCFVTAGNILAPPPMASSSHRVWPVDVFPSTQPRNHGIAGVWKRKGRPHSAQRLLICCPPPVYGHDYKAHKSSCSNQRSPM